MLSWCGSRLALHYSSPTWLAMPIVAVDRMPSASLPHISPFIPFFVGVIRAWGVNVSSISACPSFPIRGILIGIGELAEGDASAFGLVDPFANLMPHNIDMSIFCIADTVIAGTPLYPVANGKFGSGWVFWLVINAKWLDCFASVRQFTRPNHPNQIAGDIYALAFGEVHIAVRAYWTLPQIRIIVSP